MTNALNYDQLETVLLSLSPGAPDSRVKIAQMRRSMDEACDQRTITILQWRSLLDKISLVQAKLALAEPNAWRNPSIMF